MAIFPHIQTEKTVQVNDRFRIDVSRSYTTKDEAAISLVEIEPESGFGFIDVTGNSVRDWFLDFQYNTDGVKTVSCRITTTGSPETVTFDITCLTEADDKLFSDDDDFLQHESDVLKYLKNGKNSFKNYHREAQRMILEYIYRIGITDRDGNQLTKDALIDVDEVRFWSKYTTLALIMFDQSTTPGDQFALLAQNYMSKANDSRHDSIIKLDINGDGTIDSKEHVDITWRRLVRV